MSQSTDILQENRKRTREDNDPLPATQGSACLNGLAPKFSRHKEGSSDVKYGTGVETNEHRIETRLKQIQFGKNTIGYDNYLAAVPKEKRSKQSAKHPRTPDPYEESSKRQFDGRVKAWRRDLHKWDVMDNIASIVVPRKPAAGTSTISDGKKEVESGEVVEGVVNSSGFGSWAKKAEPVSVTVVGPVQILSANVNKPTKKGSTSSSGSGGESGGGFDPSRSSTEVDSPAGKAPVSYLIGEDAEGLDGIDYDCEAPDDGDEDVL